MPLPRVVARANRRLLNPIARRFSGRVPPFATILHHGRVSAKLFRTPMMAFRTPTGFVIVLTYGPDADWVKNVVAAGRCQLEYGGKTFTLVDPRLGKRKDVWDALPRFVTIVTGLMKVTHVLNMENEPGGGASYEPR